MDDLVHPNARTIEKLFAWLDRHGHASMAECYQLDAMFSDIAFDLRGRKQIHAMWHMICQTDIRCTVEDISADDATGRARIVDVYTFSNTGRRVQNRITSQFRFRGGLIIEHQDSCDPLQWARQAFGGIKGEIAGRVSFVRRRAATRKLEDFVAAHPEYR